MFSLPEGRPDFYEFRGRITGTPHLALEQKHFVFRRTPRQVASGAQGYVYGYLILLIGRNTCKYLGLRARG
jgi:hypothetical protein